MCVFVLMTLMYKFIRKSNFRKELTCLNLCCLELDAQQSKSEDSNGIEVKMKTILNESEETIAS